MPTRRQWSSDTKAPTGSCRRARAAGSATYVETINSPPCGSWIRFQIPTGSGAAVRTQQLHACPLRVAGVLNVGQRLLRKTFMAQRVRRRADPFAQSQLHRALRAGEAERHRAGERRAAVLRPDRIGRRVQGRRLGVPLTKGIIGEEDVDFRAEPRAIAARVPPSFGGEQLPGRRGRPSAGLTQKKLSPPWGAKVPTPALRRARAAPGSRRGTGTRR